MSTRREQAHSSFLLAKAERYRNSEQTLVEYLKKALEDEIVSGRLLSGMHLDEQRLADWFGVSRTPVREALRALVAINLVEKRPRRGFIVKRITVSELADLFEAMALMEAACGRLCTQRMNQQELSRFHVLYEQMSLTVTNNDADEYAELNSRFHAMLYQCSHNQALAESVSNLRQRTAPFRRAQFRMTQRIHASHREHHAILNSIITRQADDAYVQLYAHILSARDSACEYLDAMSHDLSTTQHADDQPLLSV